MIDPVHKIILHIHICTRKCTSMFKYSAIDCIISPARSISSVDIVTYKKERPLYIVYVCFATENFNSAQMIVVCKLEMH